MCHWYGSVSRIGIAFQIIPGAASTPFLRYWTNQAAFVFKIASVLYPEVPMVRYMLIPEIIVFDNARKPSSRAKANLIQKREPYCSAQMAPQSSFPISQYGQHGSPGFFHLPVSDPFQGTVGQLESQGIGRKISQSRTESWQSLGSDLTCGFSADYGFDWDLIFNISNNKAEQLAHENNFSSSYLVPLENGQPPPLTQSAVALDQLTIFTRSSLGSISFANEQTYFSQMGQQFKQQLQHYTTTERSLSQVSERVSPLGVCAQNFSRSTNQYALIKEQPELRHAPTSLEWTDNSQLLPKQAEQSVLRFAFVDKRSSGRHSEPFRRKDYRDHLRDFHKEDIGACRGENSAKTEKERLKCLRYAKCLVNKLFKYDGCECPNCKKTCEPEKIKTMMALRLEKNPQKKESQISSQACGPHHGIDGWLDNGFGGWDPCIRCDGEPAHMEGQTLR
ncbi:hypothetical protein MBM_07905 [Drepanopeziza brunnea f. sp. 'multigermtubi' MB_m1]|uniref:Uncharacterized protein n=1 Tax=Marssonina brunnea f. sp. multigermtubi (strain MB_m1) TaxID=1072389 RepID=K1XMM5_MARBU|nr:uncharacterized protein MBM_07905 [Drepanopeziza brunnea f. sp. 'multigermtubi' MB_m1]EKD13704.1 hypothetical protein MBM_07905 [Drepanopeziza brunnea f. sp. 'multigermtubi' MB_m1]